MCIYVCISFLNNKNKNASYLYRREVLKMLIELKLSGFDIQMYKLTKFVGFFYPSTNGSFSFR